MKPLLDWTWKVNRHYGWTMSQSTDTCCDNSTMDSEFIVRSMEKKREDSVLRLSICIYNIWEIGYFPTGDVLWIIIVGHFCRTICRTPSQILNATFECKQSNGEQTFTHRGQSTFSHHGERTTTLYHRFIKVFRGVGHQTLGVLAIFIKNVSFDTLKSSLATSILY